MSSLVSASTLSGSFDASGARAGSAGDGVWAIGVLLRDLVSLCCASCPVTGSSICSFPRLARDFSSRLQVGKAYQLVYGSSSSLPKSRTWRQNLVLYIIIDSILNECLHSISRPTMLELNIHQQHCPRLPRSLARPCPVCAPPWPRATTI